MTATLTRRPARRFLDTARVAECWLNTFVCVQARLEHYRNGRGEHVVALSVLAGEESEPLVSRFATVEEARAKWAELRNWLRNLGYVKEAK